MKTKKEEAIRNAYGEYWQQLKDFITPNGYIPAKNVSNDLDSINEWIQLDSLDEIGYNGESIGTSHYRPITLRGIDTNNGWISIDSEEDYPNPGQYWVIDDDGDMFITDMEFFEDIFDWSFIRYYQHIVKPEPPIY